MDSGKRTFLQGWEATFGSKERVNVRASKPFTKDNGKQEKDKDLVLFTTIMDADSKALFPTT